MLKRKAYEKLHEWKKQSNHKALCIIGARQIGKTTLVREFGKTYQNFVELNFITEPSAKAIFEDSLDANTIITNLTAFVQKPMTPSNTLILLDEIQECPNARAAIKFLVEDGRFDYIESGSLLGVKMKNVPSYPVGFEELYRMYPMDFEEFLWANGVQESTIQHLKKCYETLTPVSNSIHETMNKLFYNYIVVGGMPEAVQIFVNTHDIGKVIAFQHEILEQYRLDISKYSDNSDKPKIQAVFDSIPSQLNDNNRRFYVNSIDKNARLERYRNSFMWLSNAGVALPCYNVDAPQPPLEINKKHSLFKLFQNDVGLLCAACMENIQFDILRGNLDINLGSILENVMAQQLKTNGFTLYYFDSAKHGEIDFAIQNGMKIDLIEIKSGKDYKTHRALDKIRSVSEWKFGKSIVFCKGNIENDNDITYLPFYMIAFYTPPEFPENFKYEVDISNL